jgi:predicted O-methyltransferase YrrM
MTSDKKSEQLKSLFFERLYLELLGRDGNIHDIHYLSDSTKDIESLINAVHTFFDSEEYERRKKYYDPAGYPPGHFYSPINDRESLKDYFESIDYKNQINEVNIDDEKIVDHWKAMLPYLLNVRFEEHPTENSFYHLAQDAFCYGDAAIYESMIHLLKPARIIEIGAGYSTAVALDALKKTGAQCSLTACDPYPELLKKILNGRENTIKIHAKKAQDLPQVLFEKLAKNDILFLDTTHVIKTNSDVVFEFFNILPKLAVGVILHLHDIFWPFEYPKEWIMDDARSWNELYFFRAWLTNNDSWEIIFFNDYFKHFHGQRVMNDYPAFFKNSGGSIYLRKVK